MDMDYKLDVRVLTFMRWNLPPMGSFCQLFAGSTPDSQSGKYVSFQNYQLIDIARCDLSEVQNAHNAQMFADAYNLLNRKRLEQTSQWVEAPPADSRQPADGAAYSRGTPDRSETPNLYIQQSLPVFGRESSFWEDDPKVLYITLVQLTERRTFTKLEDMKQKILKKLPYEDKLALYFTTDYSDMVLLGRDIPCGEYQKALWALIFDRQNDIRDTITFSCFSLSFYLEQLTAVRGLDGACLQALRTERGKTSISADISIKDESIWSAMQKKLTLVRGCCIHQISGRNDVRVMFTGSTVRQVFYALEVLDSACKDGGVDAYEVVPLLEIESIRQKSAPAVFGDGSILELIQSLHTRYRAAVARIFGQSEDTQANAFSYEIYHTLYALSRSGFADEFVLSVLPSLVEYTRVCETYANAIANPTTYSTHVDLENAASRDQWKQKVLDKLEYVQREYIQALSTLVQCTIHGERQFVQVPALNCPIFNVPPKLLALYASMANLVTDALNDSDRTFSFLIVPDFRDDIYVRPITKRLGDVKIAISHPHNLLIIYLNEKMFYKPVALLSTLCHEGAHHLGGDARYREKRAKTFFRSVAMFVVCKTLPLILDDEDAISRDLPCVLAHTMGYELFNRYLEQADNAQLFFLEELSWFIKEHNAVQRILQSPLWKDGLRNAIFNCLKEYDSSKCKRHRQDLQKIASMMDQTLQTTYVSTLYSGRDTREAALGVISDNIILRMRDEVMEWYFVEGSLVGKSFHRLCEDSLQAHSEAYSDYRMIELLGLDRLQYDELFCNDMDQGSSEVQRRMRQNAIRMAVWGITPMRTAKKPTVANNSNEDIAIDFYLQYTEEQICEYLRACGKSQQIATQRKMLTAFFQKMQENNPDMIFEEIAKQLKQYRTDLQHKFLDSLTKTHEVL